LPIYIGFGSNPDNDSRTNGGPGAMSRQPLTDWEGVLIIACVARKEFALVNVIKVEKANIPVFSTQEPGSLCLGHHVPASEEDG